MDADGPRDGQHRLFKDPDEMGFFTSIDENIVRLTLMHQQIVILFLLEFTSLV